MTSAILGVNALVGLVNLVAFVIILIQLFKVKGVGHGIAGLCCGLYTFIWGWGNVDALDANKPPLGLSYKKWMLVWTACIVLSFVLTALSKVTRPGY